MSKTLIRNLTGRIGLALLWFGVFSIPLVEITTCTQGSEDAWMLSFFFYLPASLIFLGLAWIGTKTPSGIRWLSLPLFVLLPWAGFTTSKYIIGVTINKNHPCSIATGEAGFNAYSASWWSVLWGPLQLLFVLLVGWCLFKYWSQKTAKV